MAASAVGPTEDTVMALIDYFVDPLLPPKSLPHEVPSLPQQESVAKQVHAVVVLYNYYHRKLHLPMEFLGFESFCKLAVIIKPTLLSFMKLMQGRSTMQLGDADLEKQLSVTEQAILYSCNISLSLDASKGNPSIEGWPLAKVTVFLVDFTREKCFMLYSSVTQGAWSVIEKDIDGTITRSDVSVDQEPAKKKKKINKKRARDNSTSSGIDFEQLAFSAIKEVTGINSSDLLVLESHLVYSVTKDKTVTRFFVVQFTRSRNDVVFQVPVKNLISSMQGPLVERNSFGWTVTPVVEYFHVLPFTAVLLDWFSRELSSACLTSSTLKMGTKNGNCQQISAEISSKGADEKNAIGKSLYATNSNGDDGSTKKLGIVDTANTVIENGNHRQISAEISFKEATEKNAPGIPLNATNCNGGDQSFKKLRIVGAMKGVTENDNCRQISAEISSKGADEKNAIGKSLNATNSNGGDGSTKKLGIVDTANTVTENGNHRQISAEISFKEATEKNAAGIPLNTTNCNGGDQSFKKLRIVDAKKGVTENDNCRQISAEISFKEAAEKGKPLNAENSNGSDGSAKKLGIIDAKNTPAENGNSRHISADISLKDAVQKNAVSKPLHTTKSNGGDRSFNKLGIVDSKNTVIESRNHQKISAEISFKEVAEKNAVGKPLSTTDPNGGDAFVNKSGIVDAKNTLTTVEKPPIPLLHDDANRRVQSSSTAFCQADIMDVDNGVKSIGVQTTDLITSSSSQECQQREDYVPGFSNAFPKSGNMAADHRLPCDSDEKNTGRSLVPKIGRPNCHERYAEPCATDMLTCVSERAVNSCAGNNLTNSMLPESVVEPAAAVRQPKGQAVGKSHSNIVSKDNLFQAALRGLSRKRERLCHQQRAIEAEITRCDEVIQTILTCREDEYALKIELIVEGCCSMNLNGSFMNQNRTCDPYEGELPSVRRRRISEAVLTVQNPCQELELICHQNGWIPPAYHVATRNGGFQAESTVKGRDFECSAGGDLLADSCDARQSAATQMLVKLKSMWKAC